MEIEKIIERISQHRTKKGYTYENMAHELNLTPAAYRKIETGETKLTVERLFRISDILDLPVVDFLDLEKDVLSQHNHDNENVFQQKVNFYNDNKEVYQQLLNSKDEQIALLKEMLNFKK
ncbi:MAG: transcriptional regulator [Chryseobacterium sp.]|jgi:transcriptional regulator with XRE-family HTH domain|nr:transcriptional regulator [Chryseobacterium sp.]